MKKDQIVILLSAQHWEKSTKSIAEKREAVNGSFPEQQIVNLLD